MRRRALGLLSVTLLVTAAPLGAATGQTGILDPTFGGDGTVTTALTTPWFSESEDSANAIALLPDGRIVAAGSVGCRLSVIDRACSFAVARYLADGALDASFSGDGIATVRFPSGGAAYDVVVQPDGKVLVVGTAYVADPGVWAFALARFNENGALDPTFGGNGKVKTPLDADAFAFAAALQPGGKVVVVGDGIARYDVDGSLDETFGSGGFLPTLPMRDVAIDAGGEIVTVGRAHRRFGIYRYDADGVPDTAFGGDGKAAVSFGPGIARATTLTLGPDGSVVAAGSYREDRKIRFAVARVGSEGTLDPTFAGDGTITTTFMVAFEGYTHSIARGVALQADGSVVAAGAAWLSENLVQDNAWLSRFAVARYTASGTLDPTFSGDGKLLTRFRGSRPFQQATSVAIQPDDAILVAGEAPSGGGNFGLARYVVPAVLPDAQIREAVSWTPFVGDDVYASSPAVQEWVTWRRHGADFVVRIENDGSTPGTVLLRGCGSNDRFVVRYVAGQTAITAKVVDGTYAVGPLEPGGAGKIRMEVRERTSTPDGARLTCPVTVRSLADPNRVDAVRSVTYVGPVSCRPEIRGDGEVLACAP